MLTKPGNTQVYSPFGSYVVEQHDEGFDRSRRTVPEPRTAEYAPAAQQEMAKAA